METENSHLRAHIADLQAQLRDLGADPRPPPAYAHGWTAQPLRPSASPTPAYHAPAADKVSVNSLPQFKHGSIGDNYLGVASGDSLLSHIRGTSLSVFGTEVDITDFVDDTAEYEGSPTSYHTLVNLTMGSQLVDPAPLPQYESLREWATWYLRSLNPYTMLVHKPAFMELIWRFGKDPTFTPS